MDKTMRVAERLNHVQRKSTARRNALRSLQAYVVRQQAAYADLLGRKAAAEANLAALRSEADELADTLRQQVRAIEDKIWTPKDGVWMVERGGQSKRWISDLPDGVGLAPFARHTEEIAKEVAKAMDVPCTPMAVAEAVVRWMREQDAVGVSHD